MTIPSPLLHFRTEADRDRRIAEWQAARNELRNGMECLVAGRLSVYRNGRWT